jgi:ubiquinone/menaquinone biosynthesis C-methylase UbiE
VSKRSRSPAAVVYDRVAAIYDWYTVPMEALGGRQSRRRLFGRARGRVLELGVGTGLNLSSYPAGVELVGLDISPRTLARAQRRAHALGLTAALEVTDIEALPHPDASFDTVTAACVFCSVGDPVRGLREAARVVRPSGQVLLYEHVRPDSPLLGRLTDLISPLTRRLMGPELNRPTERNVEAAGLHITEVRRRGIWREIVATSRASELLRDPPASSHIQQAS